MGMHIFFSYGHDANAPFVRRLRDSLVAAGHAVWMDEDRIRPGEDWRRAIQDGEGASKRVIAFLSKHAMKPGGVCLDELAFALFHLPGRVIPVLLEPEAEAKPPVSLTHVQWLDLSAWPTRADDPAWYAAQLAEVERIIADPERERFAGEIDALHDMLRLPGGPFTWSRAARIGRLLDGFVGRDWLREKVEAWRLHRPESQLLWIAGQAGMGKSAFAAWLAHNGHARVVALSLSEFNDTPTRETATVIRVLAQQIATRDPSFRSSLLGILQREDPALRGTALETLIADPAGRRRLLDAAPGGPPWTTHELFRRIVVDPLRGGIDGGRNPVMGRGAPGALRGGWTPNCTQRAARWRGQIVKPGSTSRAAASSQAMATTRVSSPGPVVPQMLSPSRRSSACLTVKAAWPTTGCLDAAMMTLPAIVPSGSLSTSRPAACATRSSSLPSRRSPQPAWMPPSTMRKQRRKKSFSAAGYCASRIAEAHSPPSLSVTKPRAAARSNRRYSKPGTRQLCMSGRRSAGGSPSRYCTMTRGMRPGPD